MKGELILAEDLNGHFRYDRQGYERWHGGKSHRNINEEGKRILDFVRASDLVLVNTFFVQSDVQSYTFGSGQTKQ